MIYAGFISEEITVWVLIPLAIFLARVFDVSLGTIKIIFISRGMKIVASVLAFFEVLIWLVVLTQVMQNLTNPLNFIAYAAGFAMGTFVGIHIENKLAIGTVVIQVITKRGPMELIKALKGKEYKFTSLNAQGDEGRVTIIFLITKRKNIQLVIEMIKEHNPKAFYTIEDVKFVSEHLPVSGYWSGDRFSRIRWVTKKK